MNHLLVSFRSAGSEYEHAPKSVMQSVVDLTTQLRRAQTLCKPHRYSDLARVLRKCARMADHIGERDMQVNLTSLCSHVSRGDIDPERCRSVVVMIYANWYDNTLQNSATQYIPSSQ